MTARVRWQVMESHLVLEVGATGRWDVGGRFTNGSCGIVRPQIEMEIVDPPQADADL